MGNSIILPPDYVPNKKEEYMNEMQLEYFRQKLLDWKKDLLNQSSGTLEDLRQGGLNQPDDVDRASLETDKSIDLRTKDRARKLIVKIDQALDRIEDGTYGYCEETGEEIGIDRLMARPIATLCVEAQERHERISRYKCRPKISYWLPARRSAARCLNQSACSPKTYALPVLTKLRFPAKNLCRTSAAWLCLKRRLPLRPTPAKMF